MTTTHPALRALLDSITVTYRNGSYCRLCRAFNAHDCPVPAAREELERVEREPNTADGHALVSVEKDEHGHVALCSCGERLPEADYASAYGSFDFHLRLVNASRAEGYAAAREQAAATARKLTVERHKGWVVAERLGNAIADAIHAMVPNDRSPGDGGTT